MVRTVEFSGLPADLLRAANGSGFEGERARLHDPALDAPAIDEALAQLMDDESRLNAVATRSSRHHLGFERIELWRDDRTDCVLRLHVWWGDPIGPDSATLDIHNHGRPLALRLLCGGYRSEIWEAQAKPGPYTHYRYRSDDRTLQTNVQVVGSACVTLLSSETLRSGDRYALSPATLHRVIPLEGVTTASLVVQGPLAARSSDVFCQRDLTYVSVAQPLMYSSDESLAILHRLRQVLTARHPVDLGTLNPESDK